MEGTSTVVTFIYYLYILLVKMVIIEDLTSKYSWIKARILENRGLGWLCRQLVKQFPHIGNIVIINCVTRIAREQNKPFHRNTISRVTKELDDL